MKISVVLPVDVSAAAVSVVNAEYLLLEARDFMREEAAKKGRHLVGDIIVRDPIPFAEVEVLGVDPADFAGLMAFGYSSETEAD